MASATAGRSWSAGRHTSSGAAGEPADRDAVPAMRHHWTPFLRSMHHQHLVLAAGMAPVIGYHLATGDADGVYWCCRADPSPG